MLYGLILEHDLRLLDLISTVILLNTIDMMASKEQTFKNIYGID